MTKYKVEIDKKSCIGCAACVAVCPDNFEMDSDGKSKALHKEIEDKELACSRSAAEICPVNAIHIISLDSGEKLI